MMSTSFNANHRGAVIRSVLLTKGFGPIANSAYKALAQCTDLRGVILSKSKSSVSKWGKLKEYGVWYALQHLISRIFEIMTDTAHINQLLPPKMEIRIWESQGDETSLIDWLINLDIDLVIVCDFHYILTRPFFTKFKYCINIHPSLLPKYRGPNPVIWGLLDKDSTFGITLHLIDDGIDTGNIIGEREIRKPVLPLSFLIEMKLADALPDLLKQTMKQIEASSLQARKQEGGFYLPFPNLTNRRVRKKQMAEHSQSGISG